MLVGSKQERQEQRVHEEYVAYLGDRVAEELANMRLWKATVTATDSSGKTLTKTVQVVAPSQMSARASFARTNPKRGGMKIKISMPALDRYV